MEVKDIQGNILIDALVTEQAVKVDELMKQHSITLSWVSVTNDELPLGSYIEHEGVRYSLLAPYKPEQSNETTYSYKPVFEHPVMRWQYIPFFFYTYSEGEIISKELDWSLTDNPANFMKAVCDAILNETGEDWSYEISADLPASASLSFSNADIFSALNTIASVFKTEWWFDYANKIAYLSKASYGDAVTLEVGQNIGVPSKNQSSDGYYTRFYAFGSTRNIEQNYAGSNANSIVNKRLTLNPEKYPNGYIDIREGLTESEILVKTLEFDDIYPRSSLAIADVKVRLMWRLDNDNQKVQIGTDGDGNPVYDQYAIWYFKVPGLSFDKEQIIAGKALSVHFNSGALNGREFELTYHDKAKTVDTSDGTSVIIEPGEFEINFIEEGTFIIPAISGLIPSDGDEITLFNITMPEEYKASAYDELEKAALKEMAKQGEDMSNYSFSSNAVEFFMSNPALEVGRNVTYKNGNYTYSTRVIKLETQLDRPFEQKITIGNEQIKGTTQTLKEEVVNANQNIDLISAINESTQQLMQSYQRTQKALLDSMSKWGNMWRLDAENNAVYTPLNLIVEGTIGMGSLGEGGSGEVATPNITIKFYGSEIPYTPDANGIITLPAYPEGGGGSGEGGITQVTAQMIEEALGYVPYSSKNPSGYITSAALNGYATEQWVKQQGYLTQHQDLSAYAKSADVALVYATKAALQTLQNEHNALSTKVTNLDNLLNSDVSGVINTWGEVVDFLDEYSGSEDLATILAGMNNDIANRVLVTDFEKVDTSVKSLLGYFDNSGNANNALKLGGQLPSYYATKSALDTTNGNVVSLTQRMGTAESGISTNKTNIATLTTNLGDLTSRVSIAEGTIKEHTDAIALNANNIASNAKSITTNATAITAVSNRVQKFEDVIGIDSNGDVYIKGTRNFYTEGGTIGMAGLGSGGSGGGGTAGLGSVTVRVNGQDYITDASGIVTLPNYPSLAGYATEQWVVNKGYITGITSAMVTSALGYTPLSTGGGTVRAYNAFPLTIKTSTSSNLLTFITDDSTERTIIGYYSLPTRGSEFRNATSGSYIGITDAGVPHYNGNTLYHTGNFNPANYLPLSGGTVKNGSNGTTLVLDTSGSEIGVPFRIGNVNKAWVGYTSSIGVYLYNYASADYIGVKNDGTPIYNDNTLIHSGNYSEYALPLSGGTISSSHYQPLIINSTYSAVGDVRIAFSYNGDIKGIINWDSTTAFRLYNYVSASYIGVKDDGTPVYNGNTLIHSGNIGSQSVDNASKLGGYDSSRYAFINDIDSSYTHPDNIPLPYGDKQGFQGWHLPGYEYCGIIQWRDFNGNWSQIRQRYGANLYYRGTGATSWREFAFLDSNVASADYATNSGKLGGYDASVYPSFEDAGGYIGFNLRSNYQVKGQGDGYIEFYDNDWYNCVWGRVTAVNGFVGNLSGNAASATKLQAVRKIWGALFDGSADVGGGISSAGSLEFDGVPSNAGHGGFIDFHFNGSSADYTSRIIEFSSGRLTINDVLYVNNSSNVLIGTTTDSGYKLDVNGSVRLDGVHIANTPQLLFSHGGDYFDCNGNFVLAATSGSWHIFDISNARSLFSVQRESGNVLIGKTSDNGAKLQVNGGITTYGNINLQSVGEILNALAISRYDNGTGYYVGSRNAGLGVTDGGCLVYAYGNTPISFYTYKRERMRISGNGDVSMYGNLTVTGGATFGGDVYSEGTMAMARLTSSSDRKLKDNIAEVSAKQSMGIIRQLRPTTWNWKKDGKKSYGFIAQEVEPIVPEMVSSVNDTLRLEYNQLHAFEIGAIKHIDSEVDKLKKDLVIANGRIEVLENELKQYRRNA